MVLPMATSTTMYLNGSIRSWIHYLMQRLDPHAQLEHQLVAQEIEKIFKKYFPNVWEAVQLLKQSEDPYYIITHFHEWASETEWCQHGGYPGFWFNLDINEGKTHFDWAQVFEIYKNDKLWHSKNS